MLHQHGFLNWYSKAVELSGRYGINLYEISHNEAKLTIKTKVTNYFKQNWLEQLHNGDGNTVLRTYRLFKERHIMEPYLYLVKEAKYRVAISRLRASSHPLEIERGRYTRPKTPVTQRLCPCCNAIEDEHHFLLNCKIYDQDRDIMFSKISTKYENICEIESRNRFKFLLTNDDPLSRCRQSGIYCWLHRGLSTRQPPVQPAISILSLVYSPSHIYHICLFLCLIIFWHRDLHNACLKWLRTL